jgi:hypothetical protein
MSNSTFTEVAYTEAVALLTSSVVQLTLSFGLLAAFCYLRTSNKAVYEPRLKFATSDKKPHALQNNLLAWVSVYQIQEVTETEKIGLDGSCKLTI